MFAAMARARNRFAALSHPASHLGCARGSGGQRGGAPGLALRCPSREQKRPGPQVASFVHWGATQTPLGHTSGGAQSR